MSLAIAAALRPFFALLLIALIVRPLANWIGRRMKPGLLKRILFFSWKV